MAITPQRPVLRFEIDMSPRAAILVADFERMANDIRSTREPLQRSVREAIIPSIESNFEQGGNPPWAPLADSTIARKSYYGYDPDILIATGRLRRRATQQNIWQIQGQGDEMYARVESLPEDVYYGEFHEFGTDHFVARPFMTVDEDVVDKIHDIVDEWLDERLNRTLLRQGLI